MFNNVYEISEISWGKIKTLVSDKNSEIESLKEQLQYEKTLNEEHKNEMTKLKKELETTNCTLNLMISKLSESYDMLERRGLLQRKIKINEIDIKNLIDYKV